MNQFQKPDNFFAALAADDRDHDLTSSKDGVHESDRAESKSGISTTYLTFRQPWLSTRRDYMKRTSIYRKLIVIAGCVALVCAANVGVSFAATATSTTTGVVILPLTITTVQNLNFGKFMSGVAAAAGTVVVDTANGQTVTGGVTSTTALAAFAKTATFTVTGEPTATYAITYPAQTTLTGTGTAMTIGTFTNAVDVGTVALGVGTLPASGPQVLSVGATLTVGANQTAGSYTGSLDVAVNYN